MAQLLQVDHDGLKEALSATTVVTRGETIRKPYMREQACDVRDAMAKALYGRLFGWIVSQINELLAPGLAYAATQANSEQLSEIGILDIFGFEHFAENGFVVGNGRICGLASSCKGRGRTGE